MLKQPLNERITPSFCPIIVVTMGQTYNVTNIQFGISVTRNSVDLVTFFFFTLQEKKKRQTLHLVTLIQRSFLGNLGTCVEGTAYFKMFARLPEKYPSKCIHSKSYRKFYCPLISVVTSLGNILMVNFKSLLLNSKNKVLHFFIYITHRNKSNKVTITDYKYM